MQAIQEDNGRALEADHPLLSDQFGRSKRKLRLSLTDRCNYRCVYCMPEQPTWQTKSLILTFQELHQVVEIFVTRFGVGQIRLTGGEPLMRRGAAEFIQSLNDLRGRGLERVSLSTNGALLERQAQALAEAGLDDINVSLDSLSAERFAKLTGGGDVNEVLRGISLARNLGLPVKINSVVIRGVNEDDIVPLTEWACAEQVANRFIEFMPLDGRGLWSTDKVVTEREIIERLAERFSVVALPRTREPATYYQLDGRHRIGIISTVSNPFCESCDRIRLTASGQIFPCLFSSTGVDLRTPLREGAGTELLEALIRSAVWNKPRGFIDHDIARRHAAMYELGG